MSGKMVKSHCPACHCPMQLSTDQLAVPLKCPECGAGIRPKTTVKRLDGLAAEPNNVWNQLEEPAATCFTNRSRRRGVPRAVVIAAAIVAAVGLTGAVIAITRPTRPTSTVAAPIREPQKAEPPKAEPPAPQRPPASEKKDPGKAKPATVAFPRRMMVISINHYVYANPIQFGSARRNPVTLMERLADRWQIPRDQLFVLTDAKTNRGVVPPTRPTVINAIETYLRTSRSQDRIVLLFAGHATAIDGKPYLVPIDGELNAADTLIPLKWVLDQLASCKARQKLLIFDACRTDPGRGSLRPSPGPMDPCIEAELAAPRPGVQVFSSCAANQSSFEYQYQTVGGNDIEGSNFLSSFFHAFLKGGQGKNKPTDSLPIEDLAKKVEEIVQAAAKTIENQPQTPKLFGSNSAQGAEFDAKEPPAASFKIQVPNRDVVADVAAAKLVREIFAEMRCPPIKPVGTELASSAEEWENVIPFSAERLRAYDADVGSLAEIVEKPAQYPFRSGVLKALRVLERHGRGEILVGATPKSVGLLREEFTGPANEAAKRTILKEQQQGPAAMYLELEDALQNLEKLGPLKAKETSKRWQAHYDYVLALLKLRFAYINEYNFALAKIRKDELPPIDPKIHKGWRLASTDKMSSPREVKEVADEARSILTKIIQEHAGTPWEVLAKRERLTAIGLIWQPAAIKGK